ncbi:hypothetical protein [Breoghania sp.]|uniref:hypothetical protein n=1 Tax=Breoghania sp. TaxID=2065378 RepID=UPI002AA8421B|nr:hypothetical protein [Breoghania sp.]
MKKPKKTSLGKAAETGGSSNSYRSHVRAVPTAQSAMDRNGQCGLFDQTFMKVLTLTDGICGRKTQKPADFSAINNLSRLSGFYGERRWKGDTAYR